MTLRVLLTGANGQLGQTLHRLAPPLVDVVARDSRALDLRDADAVERQVRAARPDLIINAAAYTQVDRAESEEAQAWAVNAEAPRLLAEVAGGARVIHVSTDFVFDGSGTRPYRPDDAPAPLGAYGRGKLAGEQALLQAQPEALVLRTAWVYSPVGHNFLLTMLRLMASREELSVVSDQSGTPTSAASLARAIWELAALPQAKGVLHWTDAGETSWHGFASEIQRQALALGLLERRIPIHAIPSSAYPTPAKRPAYSVLDCSATHALLDRRPRSWQDELAEVLTEVAAARTFAG